MIAENLLSVTVSPAFSDTTGTTKKYCIVLKKFQYNLQEFYKEMTEHF